LSAFTEAYLDILADAAYLPFGSFLIGLEAGALAGAFLTGYFLAGAFLAGDFLAGAFLTGAFFGGIV
jgi:hypothetical protein